jgi:putative RecB family exonuclease
MAPVSKDAGALGERGVWTELAFEARLGGEVLVGSLDRLVYDGSEDRYFIIDFKVTEKPKSVDTLLESYQHQIKLYAEALYALEPASRGKTDALIINISKRTVQTVAVDVRDSFDVASLAKSASAIVKGEPGQPKTGPLCRVCEFRSHCPEGSAQ